ncbi:MAG: ATP synthase F0 subunit B [Acidobacteria bacterium]|nr:ATP synthase F0 subunit B [Acidobacteriota bacterium]
MYLILAENSIQLVPDGTLFLHILLIVLMIFLLNLTVFRPINKILEEREQHKQGGAQETRKFLKRIEENLNKYERALRDARADGYLYLEKERAKALQERQALLNSLRNELQRSIEKQKELVKSQAAQSRLTLEADTQQVAAEIGERILRRPVATRG